jgi:membrane associated rhomboid family serine protease
MAYRSKSGLRGVFYTPGFPPGVKWLLIINAAIFIFGFFIGLLQLDRPLALLALVPAQVVNWFAIWQLFTYLFLHGGFGHIIWNMLALWMFGADLERLWGTRRFLQFYFFCGVGAGICVVLLNYLLPWGNPLVPTIGSSGAIFGILLANAVLFPDRTVLWGFLIPIQMKYFVLIIGVVTFISSFQVNQGVSEFAHLGGLLFGYLWLKTPRGGWSFSPLALPRQIYRQWKWERAKRKFEVYQRKRDSDRGPWVH